MRARRGRLSESAMAYLRNISPGSAAILSAVIAAIRPRGHGFDHPIDDDVLAELDRIVALMPPMLRLGFPLGLRVLEWGPPLLRAMPSRMSRMPPDKAIGYCQSLLESRIAPLRTLMVGVRALIYIAFYQHPQVLRTMNVRWDERMNETIRLRAETLDRARYGYPR